LVLEALKDLK